MFFEQEGHQEEGPGYLLYIMELGHRVRLVRTWGSVREDLEKLDLRIRIVGFGSCPAVAESFGHKVWNPVGSYRGSSPCPVSQ
jgi:hypothetical protein